MPAKNLLLLFILVSPAVVADIAATRLLACSSLEAPLERLACFDEIVASIPTGTADGSATATATATAAVASQLPSAAIATVENTAEDVTEQQFGQEHWVSQREGTTLQARVTAARKDAYGKWLVTLDNGQVWKQLGSRTIHIAVDDRVMIERALMNSFFFQFNDNEVKTRFSRVR